MDVTNEVLLTAAAQSDPPLTNDEWHRFLAWLDESCPDTPAGLFDDGKAVS